jgi:hypothetical protein
MCQIPMDLQPSFFSVGDAWMTSGHFMQGNKFYKEKFSMEKISSQSEILPRRKTAVKQEAYE